MPRRLDQRRILERIIEAHIGQISYYRQQGKSNTDPLVVFEFGLVEGYLTKYSRYKPNKYFTYSGTLADVMK